MLFKTPAVLATGLVLLVGVQSVAAGDWTPARSNPYAKLFQPAPLSAAKVEAAQPQPLCGTAVAPTDPRLDARLRAELKKKDTRYTIRIVPQPVCK